MSNVQAYAQWVSFTIKLINFSGSVSSAALDWGKFYKYDDKDHELSAADINKLTFEKGRKYPDAIASCGRSDSPSGTEGSFYLCLQGVDPKSEAYKVCKLSWDCPWGSKTNSWGASDYDSDAYLVSIEGGSKYGGAIGQLVVTVVALNVG